MVILQTGTSNDEWFQTESVYSTRYNYWNGFVQRIGLLSSILNIRAASVCSSFRIKGKHAEECEKIIDDMGGRTGNEPFRLMIKNLYAQAWVAGDAYAEIIFSGEKPVDLEILKADNIQQVIKKGKIIEFKELDGSAHWAPSEILHVTHLKRGAMSHGLSQVELIQNILLEYEQMIQLGSEIYRNMSKPREIIYANTDSQAKLDIVRDAFRKASTTFNTPVILPKTLVDSIESTQITAPLKPAEWLEVLRDEIFLSTATPAILLGSGYANSEESMASHVAGFVGSVRADANALEDILYKQLFSQMYPSNPPTIQFSYANEAGEDKYNRIMNSLNMLPVLAQAGIAPENIVAITKELLTEIGIIE